MDPHKSTPDQLMKRDILLKKGYLAILLVIPVLLGGIIGYVARAIETNYIISAQESRHVAELLRTRDEFGERAKASRDAMMAGGQALSNASDAIYEMRDAFKEVANEMALEPTRLARRIRDATRKVDEAAQKAGKAAEDANRASDTVRSIMEPRRPHNSYQRPDPDLHKGQ